MLDFVARSGIRSVIEEYRMDEKGIEETLKRLREGKVSIELCW